MKRLILPLALMTALLSIDVHAYTALGSGAKSCSAWLPERQKKSALSQYRESWVLGFLSGVGWNGQQIKSVDNNAVFQWMDKYCLANPQKSIAEASAAVSVTLAEGLSKQAD